MLQEEDARIQSLTLGILAFLASGDDQATELRLLADLGARTYPSWSVTSVLLVRRRFDAPDPDTWETVEEIRTSMALDPNRWTHKTQEALNRGRDFGEA